MTRAVYNLLGVLFYQTNKTKAAVSTFEQLLSLDHHNLNGLENLAFVYNKLGRDRDASRKREKINEVQILKAVTFFAAPLSLMACMIFQKMYYHKYYLLYRLGE